MIFSEFDFSLLDDPTFKEDSVREELIVPLLKELGYSASGPAKIIRSKPLTHPYVLIGSKSYKVNIIPDYLLEVDDHKWILDAKSPNEDILKGKNPEQAFSYAIHPEVRAFRYALCNGRQLTIFDVNRVEPILILNMNEVEREYNKVERLLSPKAFIKPHIFNYKPDFGLYMYKLGTSSSQELYFVPMGVPMISKVEDGLYTVFVNIQFGDDWLAASFDFDEVVFQQLLKVLPDAKASQAKEALKRQPYSIYFTEDIPEVNIHARLGEKVFSNEDEDYSPLVVIDFKSY